MSKTKDEAFSQEIKGIRQNTLEDIMAERFARYSKYIIQERALPDARDGLKPVQRRILFAMNESKNTYDRSYHKSAKTVGNVIGNYHPHGDDSVYDAMVRLSQNWKTTIPLVDMQGNNGSIDDDPAAAMRYTEARLSHLANFLLEDIDKDTVEWTPNFSDEKMEPTVLPARFPNLLINGIAGIAAGYATNIPPHNLNEIVEACIYRLQHPDCDLDSLMKIVKGPDFPTGGIVMGIDGIHQAFSSGKGKVIIRSKTHFAKTKTIKQIVVTEIPYDVIKSSLVKKIDEIRINKSIDGILDVRDESDRNGLKIVIDLKNDQNEQLVLNYLLKNTDLQISFNYNMIAIVHKSPVQLSLIQALDAFLDHREEVVLRRSKYDWKKKSDRQHILEGLIKALSVLDEVIHIIRKSKDKKDAKQNLIDRFAFSEAQAEAIVSMRLYRLTNTDVLELKNELKELKKEVDRLHMIITDKKVRDQVLIAEFKEINTLFPTKRRSIIEKEVEEIVIDPLAMIPSEQVMVSISQDGYVKRSSMRSYNASTEPLSGHKEEDIIVSQGEANTRETLLFFTDRGTYGYIPIHQIEEKKWKDIGTHLSNYLRIEANEKIISAYIVDVFREDVQIVMATRSGFIKRSCLSSFEVNRMNKEMVCMKVGSEDALIQAEISYSDVDQVYLASLQGFGLQYSILDIPETGLKTKGVKGINFASQDQLAAFALSPIAQQWIVFLKEGKMKRMHVDEFAKASRPAKGNRLYKAIKSNPGHILTLLDCEKDHILYEEDEKKVIKSHEVPIMNASQTYSLPYGPLQGEQWIKEMPKIKEGLWEKKDPYIQESLFKDE